MCFKEKAILALHPMLKDNEHPENINRIGEYSAANTIAIYGANASGKSGLFKAMTAALLMIKNSNYLQVNQPIVNCVPFKFDKKSITEPSWFEFIFIADDGIKYIYGFSANQKRVVEEYLYQYRSQRPTIIFERKEDGYTFKAQKSILEPLVRFNTSNKLFLATATNWNTESTQIPYTWLSEKMISFTDAHSLANLSMECYQSEKKDAYIEFTENLLQQADINISKIKFKAKKDVINPMINTGQPFPNVKQEIENIEVKTEHVIGEGDNAYNYSLNMVEESLGTNLLFILGPFLKDAFENGMTVVIDEIDKSLHTIIVKYIIDMFRAQEINKAGAQLIFTTHDTSLLSLSTFRRDQIYFTEKNNKTGVSDLYSLDEFSVRKTENIEKGYLLGRYGAIPYIRGEEL